MYSSYGSYNSPPPELSNNPFIEHSSNPLTRYPEVGGIVSPTQSQFTPGIGPPYGVSQQQGYDVYGLQPAQQQYATGWGGSPGYQSQGQGVAYPQQSGSAVRFQPSSSFGQQLSSVIDTGGFQNGLGYQQQPQQQFAPTYGTPNGYNATGGVFGQSQAQPTQYQQTVNTPGYLAEFDPYAAIGQGSWEGQQQQQQQQQQQGRGLTPGGTSNPQTDLHPRDFIRKYKSDLEIWDVYSWKQLMNSLDSLKTAWEKRMHELDGRKRQLSTSWGGAAQQELSLIQNVRFFISLFLLAFE